MKGRRLVFVLASLPVVAAIYACSSSSSSPDATDAGGTTPPVTPPDTPPGTPPGTPPPGSPPPPGGDGGNDAEAGPPTCTGNPLTADGGTPDGGVIISAGLAQIVIESAVGNRGAGKWFADGPQFTDAVGGSLVYTSFDTNGQANTAQLVRVLPDGGARTVLRTVFDGGALPIGNAVRGAFVLTTVAGTPANIGQTNPTDGGVGTDIGVGAAGSPNDLVVGPAGDIYFTDPRYQSGAPTPTGVYRIAPGGAVTALTLDAGTNGNQYNGIALDAAQKKLYVSVTDQKEVRVVAVNADGSLVPGTPKFATTVDAPDGLAVDVGGNVWVAEADPLNGNSGRVEVFDKAGKKLGEITVPNTRPTGVAFGGGNDKAVFITTEGSAAGGTDTKAGVYKFSSNCAGFR
jgi:gluconolactonase